MSEIPKMRTIAETAKETGLTENFIRRLCLTGQIVNVRAGKKYLVNLDRFIEFLNAPPVPAAPAVQNGIRKIEV